MFFGSKESMSPIKDLLESASNKIFLEAYTEKYFNKQKEKQVDDTKILSRLNKIGRK